VPAHHVPRALCRECGTLLTATSANLSGADPTMNPDQVARELSDRIDLLIDAGPTIGGPPSTIVDVTGGSPRCIRAGAIAWHAIAEAIVRFG
jgi:L-threonylcarbamoyladenylate synthase